MKRQLLSMEEMDRIAQENIQSLGIPRWVVWLSIIWVAVWAYVGSVL
jgi:hypothetical protein